MEGRCSRGATVVWRGTRTCRHCISDGARTRRERLSKGRMGLIFPLREEKKKKKYFLGEGNNISKELEGRKYSFASHFNFHTAHLYLLLFKKEKKKRKTHHYNSICAIVCTNTINIVFFFTISFLFSPCLSPYKLINSSRFSRNSASRCSAYSK